MTSRAEQMERERDWLQGRYNECRDTRDEALRELREVRAYAELIAGAGYKLTARLAQMAPGYEAGETEFLNREAVMDAVMDWRKAVDAANAKSPQPTRHETRTWSCPASKYGCIHKTLCERNGWCAIAGSVERIEFCHQSNSNALRTLADACECGPEDDPPKRCRFCDVADLLVGNDSNRDPDRARPECPMGPQPCHNPACAERCDLADPVEGISGGYPRQGVGECHQVCQQPTEAMLQDGARVYESCLDRSGPGPRAHIEAMREAYRAMLKKHGCYESVARKKS